MPNYYGESQELKALRKENAELKAKLKEIELERADFRCMDYDTLIEFYVKNELQFADNNNGILIRWRSAYEPFKVARYERSTVISGFMKNYYSTKKGCPVLFRDEIVNEIKAKIESIYRELTPFDVKPSDDYNVWVCRAQKAIRETEQENGLWFRNQTVSKWCK